MEAGPRSSSSLRSRRRLFSLCLVALAVTFTVLILRGRREEGLTPRWPGLNAGAAYRPRKHHRLSGPTRNRSGPGASREAAPEGASNDATWENDRPLEGALTLDAKWEPVPGVGSSDAEAGLSSAKSVAGSLRPVPADRAVDARPSNDLKVVPFKLKENASNVLRTQVSSPESEEEETPRIVNASGAFGAPSAPRHTTESVLAPRTTTERPSYDLCPTCCYRFTTIDANILKPLDPDERAARGCKRRLPDALIFGVKKGGTTTLRNFLSYHPDIVFAQSELKFFTSTAEASRGLEHYRLEMPYAAPSQLTMEKTPAYSHYPKVPALISQALPRAKLIIIMRDPVERAISDYVHMQVTIAKRCWRSGRAPSRVTTTNLPADCPYKTRYEIADTFEGSVVDGRGEVKASSQLVAKGLYVLDLQRYLSFFPPEQILALDGEAFIRDPYPAVKAVERFLDVRDYFARDFFYFDAQKGFFCLNRPIAENCMSSAKGRPHPVVRPEVLRKLREFYRPYNDALRELVGVDFQWSS